MTTNLSSREHRWDSNDKDNEPRRVQDPVIALIAPSGSYRTGDFVDAARALRVQVVIATDGYVPMTDLGMSRSLAIDFSRPEWSAARVARTKPSPDAVVAVDDRGVVIAALASTILSIPANPVVAVSSTRDKAHMRATLASWDVPQPEFGLAAVNQVPIVATGIGYPCVVKPKDLSASRGVIRVDDAQAAAIAEHRIRAIVCDTTGGEEEELLVEAFIDGPEVAVEGMLVDGSLQVLALLDKPDAMDGPYFEEAMFVTPSRHPASVQSEIVEVVTSATNALGLVSGPIHAEVRVGPDRVVLIEIAARSIGGLCGRSLSFGLFGESLESLILRSALGMPGSGLERAVAATGVLMLPIESAGRLESIDGVAGALEVPGVTGFNQTIPNGGSVMTLPEGDRYLGFLFAEGLTPQAVEAALREAHAKLDIRID